MLLQIGHECFGFLYPFAIDDGFLAQAAALHAFSADSSQGFVHSGDHFGEIHPGGLVGDLSNLLFDLISTLIQFLHSLNYKSNHFISQFELDF